MKNFLLSVLLLIVSYNQSFSQNKKKDDNDFYVVTNAKDTIRCSDISVATFGWDVNCISKSGQKKHYAGEDIIAYKRAFKEGLIGKPEVRVYVKRPKKPEKTDSKLIFMELLLTHGTVNFYVYEVTAGAGGQYGSSTTYTYYLFDGDTFKEEVTRKNYEQILPKYFGDCKDFISKLNDIRFGKLSYTAREYRDVCK